MALEDYSPLSHLDDWIVLDCIGQGSFGVIHRVQRKVDGHVSAELGVVLSSAEGFA